MRTSTRLLRNASTTYIRLATTFVLGIFLTWFLIGRVGLEVFGMISIAMGAFGLSAAIEGAINGSLNREFSSAIASRQPGRVGRTLSNAIVLSALCAGVVLLLSFSLAALAYVGVFEVPIGMPKMNEALAILFAAEGVYLSIRVTLAPYRQALYGDRRVGLDNLLMVVSRISHAGSAVLVFGFLAVGRPMFEQVVMYAVVHGVLMLVDTMCSVVLARRLVPGMRIRRSEIDRGEVLSIGRSVLHTAQHLSLIDYGITFIGIVINLFFGVAYNGMWQIAIQVFGHGRLLAEGVMRGIDPIITHLKEAKREGLIEELMIRSIRYQLAVALPWVVLYIIFMEPILMLWIGGRLAGSRDLMAVSLTVSQSVNIIAVMATLCLVAMVFRVMTRGLERSLYGMGHIASYAWAAKYVCALNLVLTIGLFTIFRKPWMAALPLVLINFLYYDVIVLRAAARTVQFPVGRALRASIPRPVLAAGLLAAALFAVRTHLTALTLLSLVLLLIGTAAVYLVLVVTVVLLPDERLRLTASLRSGARRLKVAR